MPANIEILDNSNNKIISNHDDLGPLLRQDQSPKKHRTEVRFAEQLQVKEIPNLDDYTQEEKDATWYSKVAMNLVKYDTMMTIRFMNTACRADPKTTCFRGLEAMTPMGFEQRDHCRQSVRAAVVDVQEQQGLSGFVDDYELAVVSEKISYCARVSAFEYGCYDAEEARRVYQEDKDLIELLKQVA
mmetsp:Transcript_22493/g.34392  ORF Transcript_22493/g.34392 Transcript_22493/m.34392 type:complete len:186 (+) Transcript_22493:80-637(+)